MFYFYGMWEGSQERMHERNVTYVSRLECVKAAIDKQLRELENGDPECKVGIILFNNEVTIIGDGSRPSKIIAGQKLNNFDVNYWINSSNPFKELLQIGIEESDSYLTQPIKATRKILSEKMYNIEEEGQTALGPGLLISTSLAAKV